MPAILSNGSKLSYDPAPGGSGGYVDLCITSLTVSKSVVPKVDVTCLTEASNSMQYISGALSDPGEVSAEAFFDCEIFADLAALVGNAGVSWRITYGTSGCTQTALGFLTSIPEVKVGKNNDPITMTLTIQPVEEWDIQD